MPNTTEPPAYSIKVTDDTIELAEGVTVYSDTGPTGHPIDRYVVVDSGKIVSIMQGTASPNLARLLASVATTEPIPADVWATWRPAPLLVPARVGAESD